MHHGVILGLSVLHGRAQKTGTYIKQDQVSPFPADQDLRLLGQRQRQVEVLLLDLLAVAIDGRRVIRVVVAAEGRLRGSVIDAAAPGAGHVAEPRGQARVGVFSDDWRSARARDRGEMAYEAPCG